MKHHDLKPRPCPCGDWIKPYPSEKPYKFNLRKYCSVTCPVLAAKKVKYRHVRKEPER